MTKILLADDHSIIRAALKTIIETNISGSVVEETSTGDLVIEKMQRDDYDLLILDINMPGINSVDVIANILSVKPESRILIFSMNPDVPFAKIYLQLGAKGYLTKTSSHSDIIDAIHAILEGNLYISDNIKSEFNNNMITGKSGNPFDSLSPREFEVMLHVLNGETVKEICSQTGLTSSTVSTYKARIFEKLQTKNLMEIIALAKAHNIIKD